VERPAALHRRAGVGDDQRDRAQEVIMTSKMPRHLSDREEPTYITDGEWGEIQSRRDQKLTDTFRQHLDECIDNFKVLQYAQKDSRGRAISREDKRKAIRAPASKLLSAVRQMDWDTRSEIFVASWSVTMLHEWWLQAPGDVFELLERLDTNLTTLLEIMQKADKQAEKRKRKKKPGFSPEHFIHLMKKWEVLLRRHGASEAEKDAWVIAKVAARVSGQKIPPSTINRALKAIADAS
jgi:hypothetical protein